MEEKLENWFTYHSPDPEDIPKYLAIREAAKSFASVIVNNSPPSADQTVAIRRVREAVMCANAAVACKGQ